MRKVLEINVDDQHYGGVYSLVKNVIIKKPDNLKIDIAHLEEFEDDRNKKYLNSLGSDTYYIGYDGNKFVKQFVAYNKLKRVIENSKYDCVHIHSDVANKMLVFGLAARSAGVVSIIMHSHASDVDGKHRKMKRAIHYMCRIWLKYIGTTFVSCSDLASRWMFKNIDASNITTINNGIDLEKFRCNLEVREIVRKKLNITNELLLGHVGRFAYQKNHTFLIKVLSALKERYPLFRCILIGEGPDESSIKKLVKDSGLDSNVIFYGTSNEVYKLLQAMDVFLLPSYFEGLPIVGVEAQAAGLPVIFSNKITREAQLIDNVCFLPIEQNSPQLWVEKILEFKDARSDKFDMLKQAKFDISDTVNSFLSLYYKLEN